MAFLVSGCAKKTLSGIYVYNRDVRYDRYEFQSDGTVKYKSDLNGQFYDTKAGSGIYIIQGKQVTVFVKGNMDFTQPIYIQKTFKMEGENLIDIYSVTKDGQTNQDDQDRYIRQ